MNEKVKLEEAKGMVGVVGTPSGRLEIKSNKNRKVDKLGRVVIPKTLREMAGIQDGGEVDIMLVIDENGARVEVRSC